VIIVNNQNQPDSDVRVQWLLPQGVRLQRVTDATGAIVQPNFSAENGVAELPPIQFVRAGEQLRYTFVIVPTVPQQISLNVRVFSAGRPTPQQATEQVTVNPR
jgi:hypothetical protein